MPRTAVRVEFSKKHDDFLVKYLAVYCPSKEGRSGNKIFQCLAANEDGLWPWSAHHTWQSWRERYVKHSDHLDARILKYQRKHDIKSGDKRKRTADPTSIETLRSRAKRAKLEMEEEEESSSSETRAATQHERASTSRAKPTSKPIPKSPREPTEMPSQPPDVSPLREPEPANACRTPPATPSRRSNANGIEKPTPDLTALATPRSVLEISSSLPDRPATPPTDGNPEPRSPPRPVKRVKVRLCTPSDMFVSGPSSPGRDAAPGVPVGGHSSQSRPAPSAPSPAAPAVYPRAPPRLVDSLQGQVLADREGHVPRALLRRDEKGAEEEELMVVEDKVQWPPARGHPAKQKRADGPDVGVEVHHAFSQLPPRPEVPQESMAINERELARPNEQSGHGSRPLDGELPGRHTAAAQISGQVRHGVAPGVEGGRQADVVQNGASPVKRVVTTAPPPTQIPSIIPKPLSKGFKFPMPRASTRSPFRPEPPAEETRHSPPRPQPRPPSRTRAARHPALSRIRRQTIGHGHENGNGNGNENGRKLRREYDWVPSVDLVALSHSSMSTRSHSDSSAGASGPTRPPRLSLPAFAHAAPWVFGEPQGTRLASASGSGLLFRWAAPSPVHGDGRAQTSTPRFMLTPSPARSTSAHGSAPHANGTASSSTSLAPHSPDLHLTATHGLASILAHMSANHGLALGVVEGVYKRVRSLREADEVLRGMREAAEGFGEREIERRVRGRLRGGVGRGGSTGVGRKDGREEQGSGDGKTRLRYVAASEDGEGSEYSPPETSRAAMWKQRSESSSHGEEGEEGEKADGEGEDGDDEEEEEGRAVEEELLDRDEHEDDGEDGRYHGHVPLAEGATGQDKDKDDGGQETQMPKEDVWGEQRVTEVLLGDMRLAQELERKLGKGRYRRGIVGLFA
ncbi:hypothetical protein HD554DRAFT_313134 [Boletus coccyginus]|nr:hypothetical protein HD554DRAFT_313134 [Boletus coccyginus]